MTITADDIRTRYPEFSALTDQQIDPVLVSSSLTVRPERWGQMVDLGIESLTAHELAVRYRHRMVLGQGLKSIASEQNPVSFSIKGESYYELSPYGQRYKQLLDELPGIGLRVI